MGKRLCYQERATFHTGHDASRFARIFTLFLIPFTTSIIIFVIIFSFLFQPERQIKAKFEHIAEVYYAESIIQNMVNSDRFSGNLAKTLEKYTVPGFSKITLRQLSLTGPDTFKDDIYYLLKFCDGNDTYFKFYPEPPYTENSYRTTYNYSCNF